MRFLEGEIDRWQRLGIIDEATRHRLRALYPASGEADRGLDEAVARMLAAQERTPPAPRSDELTLSEQLEHQAQFHLKLERRAVLDRRQEAEAIRGATSLAPERRTVDVVDAATRTAVDLSLSTLEPQHGSIGPADAAIAHDSRWHSLLRPLLTEGALWLAGGILIIFGSLYSLRLTWDLLDNVILRAVLAVGLHAYAGGFFAAGYVLTRRRGAHALGRILFCFTLALLPLGSVASGELMALLVTRGALGVVLSVLALGATVAVQAALLAVVGGLFERASANTLATAGAGIAVLTSLIATLTAVHAPTGAYVASLGAGLLLLSYAVSRMTRTVNLRITVSLVGASALWGFAVLAARVQAAASFAPSHYSSLIAVLAALLLAADHRLRQRTGGPPRLTWLALSLYATTLFAVLLAVAGLATLGYEHLGARVHLLASSAIACGYFARAAWRHGRSVFSWLAAVCGMLAYFFLPSPFLGVLRQLHGWASGALGYSDAPLPFAYYGATFVPYLAIVAFAAWRLRTERPDLSRNLQLVLVVVAGLLCALTLTSPSDLRPMLFTFGLYGAAAFAAARVFARPRLVYAAHGLLLALACAAGTYALRNGLSLPPTLVLGAFAALAAFASNLYPHARHLWHAALAAALLSVACTLLPETTWATAAAALGGSAIALGLIAYRTRSTLAAHGAATLLLPTALGWLMHANAPASTAIQVGFAGGVACLTAALVCRRLAKLHERIGVFSGAAVTGAVLLLLGAYALGLTWFPAWAPLAVASLLGAAAALSRRWLLSAIAMSAWSLGVALTAHHLWAPSWATAVIAAASAVFAITPVVAARWEQARTRVKAVRVAALVAAVVGTLGTLWTARPGQPHASWWGFAAALGVVVFAASTIVAYRNESPIRARRLTRAVAIAVSFALAFLVEALVPLEIVGRLWVHASVLATASLAWTAMASTMREDELKREAQGVAAALALVPLAIAVTTAAFCMLMCTPVIVPAAASELLAGSWIHVASMAVLAAAVSAAARIRHAPWGRHVVLLALLLPVVSGLMLVTGVSHLAVPLSITGVAMGVLSGSKRKWMGAVLTVWWPIGVLGCAAVSSHAHLERPELALAVTVSAFVLAWVSRRRTGAPSAPLEYGWSGAAALAAQLWVIWALADRSNDLLSAAMSVAMTLTSLALHFLASRTPASQGRPSARMARSLAAASCVVGLGAGLASTGASGVSLLPLLGASAFAVGTLLLTALRDRKAWMMYGATLALPCLYVLGRCQLAGGASASMLDGLVIASAAQAAFWSARTPLVRNSVALRLAETAAVAWPLLSVLVLPVLPQAQTAVVALLLAAHYAVMSRVTGRRRYSVPASVFVQVALFCSWALVGWTDLAAYVVPIGATILFLSHVYAEELGERSRAWGRGAVVAAVLATSVGNAMVTSNVLQSLLLIPLLCVAGIVAGSMLRVRAYLLLGMAFLVTDLLLNMLRFGLENRPLGALFLTLLGLSLVSAMVVFQLEKERILRRYSLFLGELETWE